jgi:hypothetical protein
MEGEKREKRKIISRKKTIAIVAAAILLLLSCIATFIFLNGKDERKMTSMLIELGRDWYENSYYDGFSESSRAEILARYKDSGFMINLENLSLHNPESTAEKLKIFKIDEEGGCDKKETKILIKPKEPYGKTDYDIEATLSCGEKE